MAKEITIGKKPIPEDLLARITSAKKLMPPPQQIGQQLPPGVTGHKPLPTGKIVGGISPSSLSEAERNAMEGIGWTPDVPIPHNMAELLESIKREKQIEADEVILPIDPGTPPVKMDTKDIDKVDAKDRERIMEAMRSAFTQQQVMQQEAEQRSKIETAAPTIPGLQEAFNLADKAAKTQSEPVITDDRKEAEAPKSDTGANAQLAFCPHCQWDLSQTDVQEPAYKDKMVFLHAMLGQKSYVREYELFGGNVTAIFRTLNTREIDIIYKQAWRDRETQKITTEVDYWERINRYRLFLQLLAFKSIGPDGFVHDLPDGLSKETNPDCTATWNIDEDAITQGDTPIILIEEWLTQNVLKTEAVFRVVNNACNQFNRLVSKLEAMADNSDFWKQTEEPS